MRSPAGSLTHLRTRWCEGDAGAGLALCHAFQADLARAARRIPDRDQAAIRAELCDRLLSAVWTACRPETTALISQRRR